MMLMVYARIGLTFTLVAAPGIRSTPSVSKPCSSIWEINWKQTFNILLCVLELFSASLNEQITYNVYIITQKFAVDRIFLCFWKKSHQSGIYLIKKYSKNSEILLQFKTAVFYVLFNFAISVMRSCIFSIITAVFSVTWSSEIIIICWFAAQETFLIIINVENSRAAQYFSGNHDTFYFSGFFDELKVQKNSIYLKEKYFVILKMSLQSLLINLMHP